MAQVAYSVQAFDWSGGKCRGKEGDGGQLVVALFAKSNQNYESNCLDQSVMEYPLADVWPSQTPTIEVGGAEHRTKNEKEKLCDISSSNSVEGRNERRFSRPCSTSHFSAPAGDDLECGGEVA